MSGHVDQLVETQDPALPLLQSWVKEAVRPVELLPPTRSQAEVVLLSLGAWLLALPGWKPLLAGDIWIIVGVGVAGSLAQVALTEAFRRGEASLIAPLEYSALLWGVILDVALWGVLPDSITWIGAAIIVASGLYLLRREKVHVEAERP